MEQVIYNGRAVDKDGFRTFIYAADGKKKLVNSWDEFQENIGTGIWFITKQELITDKKESARKRSK